MSLINCPECEHKILERIGTICPNCGHTVSYFEGNEKRSKYGKFFALSIFIPFISFIILVITSINQISIVFGTIIYIYLAYKSCPILVKELFITKYEKLLFWGIWLVANALLVSIVYNIYNKLFFI